MTDTSIEVVDAEMADGTVIGVQVMQPEGSAGDVASVGVLSMDGVRDALASTASLVKEAIQKATPDSATVEFGLDVKVESGKLTGLLVSGQGNATLKVTLHWTSNPA